MISQDKRITIFTGHYGSGKTEISINYALQFKDTLKEITLVDLDFVNPYFRSREAKGFLEERGIDVIASAEDYFNTDLPAFSPKISGVLKNKEKRVIVDLGGDKVGARAAGRFRNQIDDNEYELFFVVNPFRPYTSNSSEVQTIVEQIEATSRLKVTALISNPNLLAETTIQDVLKGHEKVMQMSRDLGLPIKFTAVEDSVTNFPKNELASPVLEFKRLMLTPWEF